MRAQAYRGILFCFFLACALSPAKPWLAAVYMAADNDLSEASVVDLKEMARAGSTPNLDIVVFHDGAAPDGFRYYHLEAFAGELTPVVTLPEGDSAEGRSLEAFLHWAFRTYPSDRTFFLNWGHGAGFDEGLAFDRSSGTRLSATAMAEAVRGALVDDNRARPFDIAGADACLTLQIEIGLEWLGLSQFLFGFETLAPRKGFDYTRLFQWLSANAATPTRLVAKEIPTRYAESVSPRAGAGATMSVWEVEAVQPLGSHLNALAGELSGWVNVGHTRLQSVARGERIKQLFSQTPLISAKRRELFSLLSRLADWDDRGVAEEARLTADALSRVVTSGRGVRGVSVRLSVNEGEKKGRGSPQLEEWGRFLKSLDTPLP